MIKFRALRLPWPDDEPPEPEAAAEEPGETAAPATADTAAIPVDLVEMDPPGETPEGT